MPFSFIDFLASCISSGLRNRIPLFFRVGLGGGSGIVQAFSLHKILFNRISTCSTVRSLKTQPAQLSRWSLEASVRGRNKGKPDGNKKEKARVKRTFKVITLRDQIGEMANMKDTMLAKHWDENLEKWEKRCAFEARRLILEGQKRKDERTAEEDMFMMMNSKGMDAMAREFWEMKRLKIMCRRKMELQNLMSGGGGFDMGGGVGFDVGVKGDGGFGAGEGFNMGVVGGVFGFGGGGGGGFGNDGGGGVFGGGVGFGHGGASEVEASTNHGGGSVNGDDGGYGGGARSPIQVEDDGGAHSSAQVCQDDGGGV
ncbi:hypothetical protein ZWY2020_002279 [Hordeum vulgare]|nr:hypothetical protein ZWY2020_002279 [Hordeum vulgare]